MEIKNFRRYIMKKMIQTKKDQKATIQDAKRRRDKAQMKFQNGYYMGRLQCLEEIYKEGKKFEWRKPNALTDM